MKHNKILIALALSVGFSSVQMCASEQPANQSWYSWLTGKVSSAANSAYAGAQQAYATVSPYSKSIVGFSVLAAALLYNKDSLASFIQKAPRVKNEYLQNAGKSAINVGLNQQSNEIAPALLALGAYGALGGWAYSSLTGFGDLVRKVQYKETVTLIDEINEYMQEEKLTLDQKNALVNIIAQISTEFNVSSLRQMLTKYVDKILKEAGFSEELQARVIVALESYNTNFYRKKAVEFVDTINNRMREPKLTEAQTTVLVNKMVDYAMTRYLNEGMYRIVLDHINEILNELQFSKELRARIIKALDDWKHSW